MQDGHTSNKNQEIEKGDAWDSFKLAPAISNSSIYVLQNQNLIYSRYTDMVDTCQYALM